MVETSDEWIRSHTGIGARHIVDDADCSSDMGTRAAEAAIAKAGIKKDEIRLVVLSTCSPDYASFPSTACVMAGKLGLSNAAAFDITAACSGFVYGLAIAEGMLPAMGGYALIVASEMISRLVDWTDRDTCVLFGDGAGAAIIGLDGGPDRGLVASTLKAYGSDFDALRVESGGYRRPFADGATNLKPSIAMDGRRVYNFAVNENVVLIQECAAKAGWSLDEVKWVVPHQANARIIQAAAKRLGQPESKFFMNIEEYANTSAASIPIALGDMEKRGLLAPGDRLILVGFGAGLTSGAVALRW
jgi:3-oxoacyl-[acyl-carrier-protein] synthase-3